MSIRITILVICFICASLFLAHATKVEATGVRQPLSMMPLQVGPWRGKDAPALTDKVLALLNLTDYVERTYTANSAPVDFYIAFYDSQRQGEAIHSPMNCLPGAGWNPMERSELAVSVNSGSAQPRNIHINRVIIEHAEQRQMVLYWYQSHGRAIASEYWGKIYSIVDAIRINRTDAALVRVITPISSHTAEGAALAQNAAVGFVQEIFPVLTHYLPE